jgi:hypothetical protein
MNGADLELPVCDELRQTDALRTGESEINLAGDPTLEKRQVLRPAHTRDQQV